MQVFFLYYFRSILLFINTLIASAYIELTLFMQYNFPSILGLCLFLTACHSAVSYTHLTLPTTLNV